MKRVEAAFSRPTLTVICDRTSQQALLSLTSIDDNGSKKTLRKWDTPFYYHITTLWGSKVAFVAESILNVVSASHYRTPGLPIFPLFCQSRNRGE